MQSQSAPTYQAVITSLVPRERIANAVALNSLQFNLSRAIGPVIAGLLLANAGPGCVLRLERALLPGRDPRARQIALPPPPPRAQESLPRGLQAGLRHVVSPTLRRHALAGAAAASSRFPLITYLPVIAGDVLKTGAAGYSLLLSSIGMGAILGALTTAHRGHVPAAAASCCSRFVAFGALTLVAVLSRWQPLSMVLPRRRRLHASPPPSRPSTRSSRSMAPSALRGRVLSASSELAFRGGSPLGSLVAGCLVKRLGAPVVMAVYAAILGLIATALLAATGAIARG